MLPRIFVGGTGRSGTWILYKILGAHRDVHAFEAEMRFLVDPNGLMDLIDALTVNYAPLRAREAIYRFEYLMRVIGASPGQHPYEMYDFPTWFGDDYYWQHLNRFMAQVKETCFDAPGLLIDRPVNGARQHLLKRLRRRLRSDSTPAKVDAVSGSRVAVGRYFSDRRILTQLAAQFVDDLFMQAARANGKVTWCEKTPQHLLHVGFIWELFPESVFIHVMRDPRGVAHSLTRQTWAPGDLGAACLFLKGVYGRWFDLKANMSFDSYKFLEVKLEELAASPQSELEKIIAFCELDHQFVDPPAISIDRVNYWRHTMSPEEIGQVNEILGPYIERLGYPL